MKFNPLKNDKSTFWDEVVLAVIVIVSIAIGVLLIVFKPTFWIIPDSITILIGVFFVLFGFMFLPGLIYRLFTNDKH